MWKFNRTTLFVIMLLMSICSGISIYMINWDVFEKNEGIFREIHLPIIFIGLTFFFMVNYVKKLNDNEKR